MKNNNLNYNFISDIIVLIIISFYIYLFLFQFNEHSQINSIGELVFFYILFLIVLSKYQFNLALVLFILPIVLILYENSRLDNNNRYKNNRYNNTQNNRYNYKNNRYNNTQNNNNQYNSNYQFNHDPNVKLNRDDVINLGKLIDSKKTLLDKCRIGFGVDYSIKNKKKCRSLLKKYHADKINKAISNEEERKKINVKFNECCF
jgi:hypothetical protein